MDAVSRQALIGLGANLGDRAKTLRTAMGRLRDAPGIVNLVSSALYETAPVGLTDQPLFLNAVAGVETTLTPEALLSELLKIESEFGRTRGERWGPRTLDLDLLAFESEERSTDDLQLPHPRMFERAFVLVPLLELLREQPFRNPAWSSLRAKLAAPISTAGVRLFSG